MSGGSSKGHASLCVLFFFQAHALGMWGVNLSNVLKVYGYETLIPYVFACSSIAALLSPLAVGALADERVLPERILRWLGLGSAFFLALFFFGMQQHWHWGIVLGLAQVHALWSVPTFGLTTSLVMSRLSAPQLQFGGIRLWATLGWMAAGLMVSVVLQADRSVVSGYAAAVAWLVTVGFTYVIPPSVAWVVEDKPRRSVREILGLDALHLLKHTDHKVVFISAGLLNMCLAAFYPFTVLHLDDLGVKGTAGVMSIGQITEIITMVALASILGRFRLKWVFLSGMGFGVLRYGLFMMDTKVTVITGIFLHGFCFTLFFITAQIYLEQRIPLHMRARAQALLTLVINGVGNLAGALGCGWWRQWCQTEGHTDWPTFWTGMMLITLAVSVFFALAYRGAGRAGDLKRDEGTV